jgi:ribonuclease Z
MSSRELVVLGTASQVPTRYRNHNGYLLLWDDRGLLFDPGEGIQRQMTLGGVSVHRINRVLITHFHGDHCLGLPGVLQRISLDGVPHPVAVNYPASGQQYYDRLRHASIFRNRATIVAEPVSQDGIFHTNAAFTLEAHRLDHPAPTFGYRLVEPDARSLRPEALAALGLRGRAIGDLKRDGEITWEGRTVRVEDVSDRRAGQSMAFVLDTRLCDAAFTLAEGVDLLVCESTYTHTETREARAHGHLTAGQAGRIAAEAGARMLVLTHFSRRYRDTRQHLADARAVFDGPIVIAEDLLRIPVLPRRTDSERRL